MAFTHLHVHTQYSLLDGSNKIKEYVAKVKEMGMTAAAITDHGVMYGIIDFDRECKSAGINPVLGCELYVAPHSRFDREASHGDDRYYHLILLAENDKGYANLMKIVSVGFVDGYYYKPRVDFETLEKYHEGLICLSACLAGEVPRLLDRGLYEDAKEVALKYRDLFGKDNYFLELQDHGITAQQNVNQLLLRMSKETGIPLVATNDCHYTNAEDAEAHDALLCIQTGKVLSDENRMRYEGGQYYVKSEEEMRALFPYAGEACDNTQKIADRCHVTIEFGVSKLPHYDVPEGYTAKEYLRKLCSDGMERRYGDERAKYMDRLDYELSVIEKMGYVDYFLIVWDFINYARTNGIPVGPGRGSAAGSIVSYSIGITDIDPIKYALIFERFLNPERVSMPDIDVDFDYVRRGEVIDYVVKKYGKECVTQIVTFGTLKAKGVIRDVGRVQSFPYSFVDAIAKAVPDTLGITIDDALSMNPELKARYENEPDVKSIIDTARQLEGLPRQAGMHAAGVVIAQRPMDEFVPLARSKEGQIVTQFTMTTIEELGLLKMDFLGLRTLTVINDAKRMAEENHNVTIDFDRIGYDDKKVYEMISAGKTAGVFQLESAGMTAFMKELVPQSLEDIIAGISLYRPGPMDSIPNFIRWKNDPDNIMYACPQLEPILKPTYGCIVYQEQVMQIVRDLAGYTMGQSDLVRRAMSKKKMSVMQEERKKFVYGDEKEGIKGAVNNGILEEVANRIFDDMISFAAYAFNKSHAASYAFVAYQTAYLKCYYPTEFMAALMTSVMDDSKKVAMYINA
ncbi:MAG: DNA polymerase III subunit alpha, partial [Lachnospiraceae bacterium]|nr:DNA polymerase III subunit alpha [Lachnospiraceae bacterium]